MKFLLAAAVIIWLFIVIAIPSYLGPNDIRGCKQPEPVGKCSRVDAIIAVSGGDTPARTAEAIKLYKAGWSSTLIFSGAAADPNGPSNATAMGRQALEAGVPEEAILVEELSRTTAENAENTSQFIAQAGVERILLVTSAYHQRRASLEFGTNLGPSVTIINHPVSTDRQWPGFWWWTTPSGWWLAGGELLKIVAFYSSKGGHLL